MNTRKNLSPEVANLWDKLDGARGKKYWRTLEELAETETFHQIMRDEFPEQAATWPNSLSRRQFLTLMGASLALAGLNGCSVRPAPAVNLVPYVRAPEEIVPGRPLFYATAMTLGGSGVGLLVETHLGRPTKIEGNPEHPASLGATDLFHQASVLTLYDPDRSQTVTHLGETRTWDDALTVLRGVLEKQRKRQGAGLRLLTECVVSPTLNQQMRDFLKAFPQAQWHQYEPLSRDEVLQGAVMAFGKPVNTHYDFSRADVILSFDADFLSCGPGSLRYVADFSSRRRVRTKEADAKKAAMNRLYVAESAVTITGAKADHRLAVKPSEMEALVWALAAELKVPDVGLGATLPQPAQRWVKAVADDLRNADLEAGASAKKLRAPGTTLIVAGDRQPPVVHLLVQAINRHLGNFGHTVLHTTTVESLPTVQSGQHSASSVETAQMGCVESLRRLAQDMEAGLVDMLLIVGGNPAFTAPADFRFAQGMQKVPLRVHLSLFQDETSLQCHWHLPDAHFLEAWSDTRSYEGTVTIVQPMIEPLYQGRSAHELLAALTPLAGAEASQITWRQLPGHDIVKEYWRKQKPSRDFETFWEETVHDGVMKQTAFDPQNYAWNDGAKQYLAAGPQVAGNDELGYELLLQPDPTIYDGRFSNNAWLQEVPKPLTTLTWDNAALMSPGTAKALGIDWGTYAHGGEHGGYHQPVVELQRGDRTVRAPAWIVSGHADGCITVHLGYGRERAGRVGGDAGRPVGFNAYSLRTSDHLWSAADLAVRVTNETYLIACTQQHQLMENREVVRTGTLTDYRQKPSFASDKERQAEAAETRQVRKPLTMYEPHPYTEHKWGMVIDLTACTGCKACVVACQAENNIPVVGKEQVAAGREMHWLRVDRYIAGPVEEPTEFLFQPVPCMQCENAPCEYVCPVEATVHSSEGLNDMIYQRCVGTRFLFEQLPLQSTAV